MNPLSAATLLLFSVGVTFAPWHRRTPTMPGRDLGFEAGLLVTAVIAARLVAGLAQPTGTGMWWGRALLYAAGYWYAVRGGVGVVRLVLAFVPISEQSEGPAEGITLPRGELARGRLIGVLERALALTLVLLGQFGALGLIVAAKALARFRGLEDRDFAEYFLIGTLASLLHAVLVGVGLRLLL